MSNYTNRFWATIHRHEAGKHTSHCKIWNFNYKGYICKYSLEPYGVTAMELAAR